MMNRLIHTFEAFLYNGLKQEATGSGKGYMAEMESANGGLALELGQGLSHPVPGAKGRGRDIDGWEAPWLVDEESETYDAVHAYHFMEHLPPNAVKIMLDEIARVLKTGGLFYMVVPYAGQGGHAFSNIEHESFWNEETLRNLYTPPRASGADRAYHEPEAFGMEVVYQVIAGVKGHNLCLFAQLVRTDEG